MPIFIYVILGIVLLFLISVTIVNVVTYRGAKKLKLELEKETELTEFSKILYSSSAISCVTNLNRKCKRCKEEPGDLYEHSRYRVKKKDGVIRINSTHSIIICSKCSYKSISILKKKSYKGLQINVR